MHVRNVVPGLLMAVALLPLLGACSDVATQANAADAVRGSAEKAESAKTAQFEVALTVEGVPMLGQLNASGNGALDSDARQLQMTLELMGMQIDTVEDAGTVYTRADLLGDKWLKLDASEQLKNSTGTSDPFTGPLTDPSQVLQYLTGVSDDVKMVGTETIRDRETTHFQATVNIRTATEKQLGSVPPGLDEALQALGTDTVPYDVWIDSDGYLARLAFGVNLSSSLLPELQSLKGTARFDFYDWGKPVTIAVPPADQVADGASALRSLFGWKP